MKKTKKVLYLYSALINGEEIKMESFCSEYKVSIPTFRRYLSLVRDFLWEKYLKEVNYDKNNQTYTIKNDADIKN